MTTYSQSDWAARALQKASIVAMDETPPADLSDWAIEIGASLFAQFSTEGVQVVNGSDEALPKEYFQIFSSLVSCDLKAEVGLISDVEAEQMKSALKMTMRSMNSKPPTGERQQAEYF